MNTIKDVIMIDGKPFEYERVSWYSVVGTINTDIALDALKTAKSILLKYNVKPFLMWGTLLGAVREKGFIPHDNDVDLGIVFSDMEQLERAIPELFANDFKICRFKKGYIYSFNYKGIVCDIDIIRKTFFPYSMYYAVVLEQLVPKKHFSSFEEINFCGVQVNIPNQSESFLEYRYGKDWRIPKNSISNLFTPKWMIVTRFLYRLRRKIKFIRYHKFGHYDPDFF